MHMPGQDGRAATGWVVGISVLLAGVLLSAIGVAALRGGTAAADTVLARGADAVLALADGSSRAAVEGERVPRGATVRAGRTGAELATRGRVVHLGADTAVTVLDGARQVLRAGFVLVDSSDSPGLELQGSAATVTTADGSLVRVDGGSLTRVGVLRGGAADVRATGRRASAEVPTYFQVQVATGGLPGSITPFVLTPGDSYERLLAADLVGADEDLNALGSRLDAGGEAGRVVLAAVQEELTAGTGPEAPLTYLVARAARKGGPSVPDRFSTVASLRSEGGSWGVVAAIVSAPVGGVSSALDVLLDPGSEPVLAGGPPEIDLGEALDLNGGGEGAGTGEGDGDGGAEEPGAAPSPAPRPTGGGGAPSPAPSPTPGLLDPVTTVVDDVVGTVLDLITPSSAPARSSTSPSPTASPLAEVLDPLRP